MFEQAAAFSQNFDETPLPSGEGGRNKTDGRGKNDLTNL